MREPAESDSAVITAAHAALLEITEETTVGSLLGVDEPEAGVVDVLYASAMPGYPDWRWTVSVSVLDGVDAPSVLELELLPGEGSILAPEWVPWAERVTDADTAEVDDESDEDLEDDDDDESDDDLEDDLDDDDDDDDDDSDEEIDEIDLLGAADDIDGVDFESADASDDVDDDDPDDDVPIAASPEDAYDDVDPFAPLPGSEDDDPFAERTY
jgi:hypothetical protein